MYQACPSRDIESIRLSDQALKRAGVKGRFDVRLDRWAILHVPFDKSHFKERNFPLIAETGVEKATFVIEWRDGLKIGVYPKLIKSTGTWSSLSRQG